MKRNARNRENNNVVKNGEFACITRHITTWFDFVKTVLFKSLSELTSLITTEYEKQFESKVLIFQYT